MSRLLVWTALLPVLVQSYQEEHAALYTSNEPTITLPLARFESLERRLTQAEAALEALSKPYAASLEDSRNVVGVCT